jgi:hypothetical protein
MSNTDSTTHFWSEKERQYLHTVLIVDTFSLNIMKTSWSRGANYNEVEEPRSGGRDQGRRQRTAGKGSN